MPQKHSKNNTAATHFRYDEKVKAGLGSIKERIGSDSQLPFGYCCLSLQPIRDAVATPSGHLYEREAILEYLLQKTKELKAQARAYEQEQLMTAANAEQAAAQAEQSFLDTFVANEEGVSNLVKRKMTSGEDRSNYMESRKKHIDDTDRETRLKDLQEVCPWIPQFTPQAEESKIKKPSKRPASPMTSRPLKTSDLVPIDLVREDGATAEERASQGSVKFICPVSRKTIVSQRVVAIKKTHQIMLETVAKQLAYPSMTCPITGQTFEAKDVMPIMQAATGFASTGQVEAKKYRPGMN